MAVRVKAVLSLTSDGCRFRSLRDEVFKANAYHVLDKRYMRRFYDAVNVLNGVGILEITSATPRLSRWVYWKESVPDEPRDQKELVARVEAQKARAEKQLLDKKQLLKDLTMRYIAYQSLVLRNANQPASDGVLHLPFVLVSTAPSDRIHLQLSQDKKTAKLHFGQEFSMADDGMILRKLGLEDPNLVPREMAAVVQSD